MWSSMSSARPRARFQRPDPGRAFRLLARSRPSRPEPWQRTGRSVERSDSGRWKPRVPRAGIHPVPTFISSRTSVRWGMKSGSTRPMSNGRYRFRERSLAVDGYPGKMNALLRLKTQINGDLRSLCRKSSVVTRFRASAGAVRREAYANRCRSSLPDRAPRWAEPPDVPVLQSALHRAAGGPQRLNQ
jgi:hypothetical protein